MKPRVTDLSELLFVSSGPVLRCSGSALTNRWAGVLYNESYVHGSCEPSPAGVPAHESSISWEGPDHESPGGCWVPAQVSSISREGPAHESPVGCWVPAQVSSISWEGPDHESPGGCWVPAQVSSIPWEGPDHEIPVCWEGGVCMSVLSVQPAQSCLATSLWAVLG